MCLIVFDWQPTADTKLRLAANRDEFHSRPAAPLHRWQSQTLIGGRDLKGGGTWLAAGGKARIAALTNVREGAAPPLPNAPTRGDLARQALETTDLEAWLDALVRREARAYAGFNLLVLAADELWHVHHGTRETYRQPVAPGLHGLSNATLDTPWPKVVRARTLLHRAMNSPEWKAAMWTAMRDTHQAPDAELPDTHIGLERERALSPIFIEGENYGTRATALATLSQSGFELEEQRFGPAGAPLGSIARMTI